MQTILIVAVSTLCALYALLILVYRVGWGRVKAFSPQAEESLPAVSVIIPARNESARLPLLLHSLAAQRYPAQNMEIIVADDHSEDDTAAVALSFPGVQCIRMAEEPPAAAGAVAFKKRALAAAISRAAGSYIITTDADCTVGPYWLSTMVAAAEREQVVMLAAPVAFTADGSMLQAFQAVDFMMMQGITAASAALRLGGMANGANLLFRKDAYEAVGGYSGTDHIASGDDYLLLAKMQDAFPGRTGFLKSPDAIAQTAPQESWGSFLSQRIRWSSKTGRYKDHRLTAILLLVYLFNVALLLFALAAIRIPAFRMPLLAVFAGKVLPEVILFVPVSRFFRRPALVLPLLILQPLHVVYIVLAGFFGMMGTYTWKGRAVR